MPGRRASLLALSVRWTGCRSSPSRPASSHIAAPDSFRSRSRPPRHRLIKARRAWSPLGVDRLYHLAANGFYDGAVIYRSVGPRATGRFVGQFGLTNDSLVNRAWSTTGLADEPVRTPHRRGRSCSPETVPKPERSSLRSISRPIAARHGPLQGVVGFPPIAEVVEGITRLDSLNRRWGNAPIEHMDSIRAAVANTSTEPSGLDRVLRVSVPTTWLP